MIRFAASVLVATTLLMAQNPVPQSQVYRSTADIVPLFVTAVEKSGRLVTDLVRDDFQVFDNGKPQTIALFDKSPQPIRLIILIDTSGSMLGNVPLLRAACTELIRHLGAGDLVRVGTFSNEISISPTFTNDASAVAGWLPTEIVPGAGTALWHAVDKAINEFGTIAEARRVVLVLSDGKDTGPPKFGMKFLSQIEIGEHAQRDDVMIYGVGVYGSLNAAMRSGAPTMAGMMASTFPDPGLGSLALDTGGGYLELRGRDNLSAAFARVVDELHQQYMLGFAPPARDGKTHKIEIKLKRADVKPRVRKTYVAPR